jgi:uncharacterized protein (DUF697 family)
MPCDKKLVHVIIHSSTIAATTASSTLVTLPGADNLAMSPIHGAMIVAIGKCCGRSLNKDDVVAIFKAASMRIAGRVASQVLVWQVPIVGNLINVGSSAVVTEAIGWAAYKILCEEAQEIQEIGEDGEVTVTRKSPNHIDPDEFKSFVQTLEGKMQQTRKKHNTFTVQVTGEGVVVNPRTAAPTRTLRDSELEKFLDAFAVRRQSLETRDYKDMGVQSPYMLALLGKYIGK